MRCIFCKIDLNEKKTHPRHTCSLVSLKVGMTIVGYLIKVKIGYLIGVINIGK